MGFTRTQEQCTPFPVPTCGPGNLCQYNPSTLRYQCCVKATSTPPPLTYRFSTSAWEGRELTGGVVGCRNGGLPVTQAGCILGFDHTCPYGSLCEVSRLALRGLMQTATLKMDASYRAYVCCSYQPSTPSPATAR